MKRIILATMTTLAIGGYAVAQEAPQIYGDFSPSVKGSLQNNEVNDGQSAGFPDIGIDLMPTASVDEQKSDGAVTLKDVQNPTMDPNIKGR